MMKVLKSFIFGVIGILLFTSCAAIKDGKLLQSDLTLKELEEKMNKVSDPDGEFKNSTSFMLRQVIETASFFGGVEEQVLELKFSRPDYFKLTSISKNAPQSSIIYDGRLGFAVDYKKHKVVELDGLKLEQLRALVLLSTPNSNFSSTFSKVDINLCKIDEVDYYLLKCYWHEDNQEPMKFYIDKSTYLVKKSYAKLNFGGVKINVSTEVINYALKDEVMIPVETKSIENGTEKTTWVIYFKLDPKFTSDEFKAPIFDK